jgi:hypothetical protein
MPCVDLREVTQQSSPFSVGGECLEPGVRAYMEKRFNTNLGEVTIHRGKQADISARAFGARAFTYGSKIIFADGEYTPESNEGIKLLAHELVHVLQQRNAPNKQNPRARIGSFSDPCEIEADRIAEQIMQGEPILSIRSDPCPVLRRAVVVNRASAKLRRVLDDRAKADAYAGRDSLLLHCTANANLEVADGHAGRKSLGHMITFNGEVSVSIQPGSRQDEMELFSRWRFGFMQVSNTMVDEYIYAGRYNADGSIIFNLRPALVPNPAIDADGVDLPFSTVSNPVIKPIRKPGIPLSHFVVTCEGGDNPSVPVEYNFTNEGTHAPNFLFSARHDEDFLTVFTAIDPAGTRTFLASVQWHLIWHAELRWKTTGGTPAPVVIMKTQRIDPGPVQAGVEGADQVLTDVLGSPIAGMRTINDIDRDATNRAFVNNESPLRQRFPERPENLPWTFFLGENPFSAKP